MANTVPDVAPRILGLASERIKLRANSNGECFGRDIMESLREAGVELGAHHVEILRTRRVLVQAMESLGEDAYPAEILQDYETRFPLSKALRLLNAGMNWATRQRCSG